MAEEDPTLHHHFDPETKQLLVSGMGQLHVEVVVERMKRKYNVDVLLLPPRIPYKETVKGRAEVQGKYKKQTGGRGPVRRHVAPGRAARRGAAASSSSTTSSAARSRATSSPRWRRACATA